MEVITSEDDLVDDSTAANQYATDHKTDKKHADSLVPTATGL